MKYSEFSNWLKTDKSMSERSARDVVSRLKRCLKLTKLAEVDENSLTELNNSAEFEKLTSYVKSQLKRSITLYLEFMDKSL